jgi:hypothetical protein
MPYSGPVSDPFHRLGPDGRTYFDVLDPPRGLGQLYGVLVAHTRTFGVEAAAANYPAAKAYWNGWRLAFQKGIVDLEVTMAKAAVEASLVADAVAKNVLKATQVRPDTSKAKHLEDTFFSRHTPTPVVELGVVGLFDEGALSQASRGGGIYWEAQEFGTDAHVGRVVRGFFQPGRARPSQVDFRVHPEFQAQKGPRMTIRRPIQERGFLRRGVEAAWKRRDTRIIAARREVAKLLRAFKASSVPPPPAGARITRSQKPRPR